MSSAAPRSTLDRTRVVEAAIAVADEVGLEATSMRRLAERLGVTPMALYKHIADRDALVTEMVDTLVRRLSGDAAEPAGWRAQVRARILRSRDTLRAHPWAQDAIETRTMASPAVLHHMDSLMASMFDGGLSPDLVHHAMHALSTRMWGFTRDVMPTPQLPDAPQQRSAALEGFSHDYPAIVRMATAVEASAPGCDSDAEFAFALDLLLDGIERRHESGWAPAPSAVASGSSGR